MNLPMKSPIVTSPAGSSLTGSSTTPSSGSKPLLSSDPTEFEGTPEKQSAISSQLFEKEVISKPITSGKPPKPMTVVSINGFDISITQSPMKPKKMGSVVSASTADASTMTDDNVELSQMVKRMKENKEYIRAKREEK